MVKRAPLTTVVILSLTLVIGCQDRKPPSLDLVISPTATTTAVATSVLSTPTQIEERPEDLQDQGRTKATAIPTPELAPTDKLITLGVSPGVPVQIKDLLQSQTTEEPGTFQWLDEGPELLVTIGGEEPLANWIFAAAVPFYTNQDEISLEELKTAWQEGSLLVTPQTAQLLREAWGEPGIEPAQVESEKLIERLWALQELSQPALALVPFEQLSPQLKVLRVDGESPADVDFDGAGYALSFVIGLTGPAESRRRFLANWPENVTNRDDNQISHVAMTGPAGMRRAVADRMEKYGLQYPAEVTGPILQEVDIAHMSNENAFAVDCPLPDPYDSLNVCNRAEYINLMVWMGIDVNEMTGNHLNDWGSASLLYTFDLYESAGIHTFGGGRDLAQASQPLLLEDHGNKIAFIGCNPVGPASAWATADRPGSMPCDDYAPLKEQIARLAAEDYIVIVTLQYREDYRYSAAPDQRQVFRDLARAGATAVSGSQGHHPQGFAFEGDSFIHYGLGNLLADQMWSLATRQTFIDRYLIYQGRLLSVDLWTGMNEDYARIRQMTPGERIDLLEAVFDASDRPFGDQP